MGQEKPMVSKEDLMLAGIVGSARGLQGEVNVQVRTDSPLEVFQVGVEVETDQENTPSLIISSVRSHNDRLLLRFEGVVTREGAEALRGAELLVPAHHEDDAWYEHELKGLCVEDLNGRELGEVSALLSSPAHDLLVVRSGGQDVLVPFVEEIVPEVLVDEGKVIVDPPGGLFPEASDTDDTPSVS